MVSLTICTRLVRTCGWLLLLPLASRATDSNWTLVEGTIDGAPYQVALPAKHSGNLLIHAHGSRPVDSPLTVELDLDQTAYGQLLANGWIIAATAYRRNGMIVADAMTDLTLLCEHIEETYGPLAMVLLDGQSMGGAIVTHLAERRPDRFHGAVAIGAALQVKDPVHPLEFNHRPQFPLLFLSNRSEIAGPRAYVDAAAEAAVPPVVWRIDRDGHVNLNETERLIALEALVAWITTGTIEPVRDITVEIAPEQTVAFDPRGATGRVIDITDNYGNVFIDFQDGDFERLGIRTGSRFSLSIDEVTVEVHYRNNLLRCAHGRMDRVSHRGRRHHRGHQLRQCLPTSRGGHRRRGHDQAHGSGQRVGSALNGAKTRPCQDRRPVLPPKGSLRYPDALARSG